MKQILMVGGLPRSGSTLLMNILGQNPALHVTPSSGMMDVCFGVRNNWNKLIEHKANPELAAKKLPTVLRGIMQSYYQDVPEDIVVDKCRGWVSLFEMFAPLVDMKVVVPVRDVRDVLASFEKLYRKASQSGQMLGEADNYFQFQTVEGRCHYWTQNNQPVGLAINRIRDAVKRGWKDRMFFCDFDALTNNPQETMQRIYEFWGLDPYEHDFNHVEQVTQEDDTVHLFGPGLHDIRSKVEPVKSSFADVLGDAVKPYTKIAKFWETL